MNEAENVLSESAITWVKTHQKEIIKRFTGTYTAASDVPVSIFMAGSPGAGKTEFSKGLLSQLRDSIVRIDPDEVRNFLPHYTPGKAHIFQGAVSVAVEKIHDHVLHKNMNFLLDGTFSNLAKVRTNVLRSVERKRVVIIEYVYQDPLIAWDFTLKRERIEGRNIPKESFVQQLFAARDNVDAIRAEFGDRVTVDLVQRNITKGTYQVEFNVEKVADKVLLGYSVETVLQQI